jgi:hypothetical protein
MSAKKRKRAATFARSLMSDRKQRSNQANNRRNEREMIAARRITFAVGGQLRVETFADQRRDACANVFLRAACGWASREVERL